MTSCGRRLVEAARSVDHGRPPRRVARGGEGAAGAAQAVWGEAEGEAGARAVGVLAPAAAGGGSSSCARAQRLGGRREAQEALSAGALPPEPTRVAGLLEFAGARGRHDPLAHDRGGVPEGAPRAHELAGGRHLRRAHAVGEAGRPRCGEVAFSVGGATVLCGVVPPSEGMASLATTAMDFEGLDPPAGHRRGASASWRQDRVGDGGARAGERQAVASRPALRLHEQGLGGREGQRRPRRRRTTSSSWALRLLEVLLPGCAKTRTTRCASGLPVRLYGEAQAGGGYGGRPDRGHAVRATQGEPDPRSGTRCSWTRWKSNWSTTTGAACS